MTDITEAGSLILEVGWHVGGIIFSVRPEVVGQGVSAVVNLFAIEDPDSIEETGLNLVVHVVVGDVRHIVRCDHRVTLLASSVPALKPLLESVILVGVTRRSS